MPMVGRDTLVSTTTEAQARMSIFARSLTPYIQSHSEVSKKAEALANSDLNKCARINQQTVNHWVIYFFYLQFRSLKNRLKIIENN